MEGVFFMLVGAALFAQSWYILGMYAEGRTMGVVVGGLGLLSLATITFAPTLLTSEGLKAFIPEDVVTAETTVLKGLIITWALYTVGVAANGLWDFDERAIGFYSVFLAVASLVPFLYFAVELESRYTNAVWLGMSGATLMLTVIASIMFFYLAFSYTVLRLVAGWFALLGGGVVAAFGLAMVSTVIS